MDISKYASFFHDGTIHDINHNKKKIRLSMESAELLPEWNEDSIDLSKKNRISGYLHVENITKVKIDEKSYTELLKKIYDDGDIYDFEVQENKVLLIVQWINYSPMPHKVTDFFKIEIEAEKIYWENIPTLFDA